MWKTTIALRQFIAVGENQKKNYSQDKKKKFIHSINKSKIDLSLKKKSVIKNFAK